MDSEDEAAWTRLPWDQASQHSSMEGGGAGEPPTPGWEAMLTTDGC